MGFKVILIIFILLNQCLAESQISFPESIFPKILRKEKLSTSDSKRLRITLNAYISTAFENGNLNKTSQEILIYASLYSLYDSSFRKSINLNKLWMQQSNMTKDREARSAELQVFEKLKSALPKPEFLITINKYFNLIKTFDLKQHIPFLMFHCNILLDVGQDFATKQCLEYVQKNISVDSGEYQNFARTKYSFHLTVNEFNSAIEFAKLMANTLNDENQKNEWRFLLARAEFNNEMYDQVNLNIQNINVDSLGVVVRISFDLLKAELLSTKGQNQEAIKVLISYRDLPLENKSLIRYYTVASVMYYSSGNLKNALESAEKAISEVEGSFRQMCFARLSLVAFKLINNVSIAAEDKKYFEKAKSDYKLYNADSRFLNDVIQAGYLLTLGRKTDSEALAQILARILKVVPKNYPLSVLGKLKLN